MAGWYRFYPDQPATLFRSTSGRLATPYPAALGVGLGGQEFDPLLQESLGVVAVAGAVPLQVLYGVADAQQHGVTDLAANPLKHDCSLVERAVTGC
jgi:hypothetical protein